METQRRVSEILITAARQRYNDYYGEEMTLNKEFNVFVAKCQLAYQGPNTLKGQIDANVKNASKTGEKDRDYICG